MDIVINIDVKAIVENEIRRIVRDSVTINNVVVEAMADQISAAPATSISDAVEVTVDTSVVAKVLDVVKPTTAETLATGQAIPDGGWEFEKAAPGHRRTKVQMALHEKELTLGRRLTPEEKGEGAAFVQLNEEAEADAKQAALNKARIDTMTNEGMAAAKKEIEEEGITPEAVNTSSLFDDPSDNVPAQDAGTAAQPDSSPTPFLDQAIADKAEIPATEEISTDSLFK